VVFKRRTKRSLPTVVREFFLPRGGWRRASSYVMHRLRRLPDSPERISRGIASGIAVSFLPIFGLHFLAAALMAWIVRGNILAALLGTFFGNPFTFPFMAVAAMEAGKWMLGQSGTVGFAAIMSAFGQASTELWTNFTAIFTTQNFYWDRLSVFFEYVFLPYFIGGIPTGLLGGLAGYLVFVQLIRAYQRARVARVRARFEKLRAARGAAAADQQPDGDARDQRR
jgi:uncharacterized protein